MLSKSNPILNKNEIKIKILENFELLNLPYQIFECRKKFSENKITIFYEIQNHVGHHLTSLQKKKEIITEKNKKFLKNSIFGLYSYILIIDTKWCFLLSIRLNNPSCC